MTKDVLVSVRSTHMRTGRQQPGGYHGRQLLFQNGNYIIYDEILEGEEGSILYHQSQWTASKYDKGGDARAHMIFQENRPNVAVM